MNGTGPDARHIGIVPGAAVEPVISGDVLEGVGAGPENIPAKDHVIAVVAIQGVGAEGPGNDIVTGTPVCVVALQSVIAASAVDVIIPTCADNLVIAVAA